MCWMAAGPSLQVRERNEMPKRVRLFEIRTVCIHEIHLPQRATSGLERIVSQVIHSGVEFRPEHCFKIAQLLSAARLPRNAGTYDSEIFGRLNADGNTF